MFMPEAVKKTTELNATETTEHGALLVFFNLAGISSCKVYR
jgi:hypothetical protein